MLEKWINEWLVQAFLKNDGGKFPETDDVRYRITAVRSDFCDDGEAILSKNNKDEYFVAYNFGIRLEYQGTLLLRCRSLGSAKGVVWIRNVCSDDTPDSQTERSIEVYGDWEEGGMSAHQQQQNKGGRDPTMYEQEIKAQFLDIVGGEIHERIGSLQTSLAQIAECEGRNIPDAEESARRISRRVPEEDDEIVKARAQAAQAATEYVEEVRRKHRSGRFIEALENFSLETLALNLCDLRAPEILELMDALTHNESAARCLDLRQNKQLDDSALQPLFIALTNPGFLPRLCDLKLQGTSTTLISRNMAQGLQMLRKGLVIEFDP